MKRILTTLSEKWPEYLLEILVLIIGIYGAFAVDEWRENSKDQELVQEYIKLLEIDLNEDIAHFDELTAKLQYQIDYIDSLEAVLRQPRIKESDLNDIILRNFAIIGNLYEDASLNNSTFQNLQNSGRMNLLPEALQRALMKLNLRQIEYQGDITHNIGTKKYILAPLVDKVPFSGDNFEFKVNSELQKTINSDIKWDEVRISFFNNLSAVRITGQIAINNLLELKTDTESALEVIEISKEK